MHIFVLFRLIQIANYCVATESDAGAADAASKAAKGNFGPCVNDFG